MSDYITALVLSMFFLALFVGGFWLGVNWQIRREQ